MYITTDPNNIEPLLVNSPGSYEWWYFDAYDKENDCSIVAIFYSSNPFSTKKIVDIDSDSFDSEKLYPAISISVYKDGKTIFYSFEEFDGSEFSWDEKKGSLRFGPYTIAYNLTPDVMEVNLNFSQSLESDLNIDFDLNFKSPRSDELLQTDQQNRDHIWNLLMPRADVKGHLLIKDRTEHNEIAFNGIGYHDHNCGNEPMKDSFKDWYWGRYHFPSGTLIYYLMNNNDSRQYEAWFIKKGSNELIKLDEVEEKQKSRNFFFLESARKVILTGNGIKITVQKSRIIDNGPYYQRFLGEAILDHDSSFESCVGISEYIKPSRIYSRVFWPLVHMRLHYTSQKTHWVQKSNFWYKLTW